MSVLNALDVVNVSKVDGRRHSTRLYACKNFSDRMKFNPRNLYTRIPCLAMVYVCTNFSDQILFNFWLAWFWNSFGMTLKILLEMQCLLSQLLDLSFNSFVEHA